MNRLCRCALLAACALLAPSLAQAVPMPPQEVTLKNPDGPSFRARFLGDEFFSWAEDEHGYALVWDLADRSWHYAQPSREGKLVALPGRPGQADPAKLGLKPHQGPGKAALARAHQKRQKMRPGIRQVQTTGNLSLLVVLVKFNCPIPAPPGQDCSTSNAGTTFGPTDFDKLFNGVTGSVADWYRENSGGKLKLSYTIGGGDWIPLQYNDMHYAYNETVDGTPSQGHPEDMISEAVRYLGCDSTLPNIKPPANCTQFGFAPFADANGAINAVSVVHVGPGYEALQTPDPHLIHSHESELPSPVVTWDGKQILRYHTEPEVQAQKSPVQPTEIGVICHETGHTLGLPDLYDTTYATAGLGLFSVMAAGSWGGPENDGTVPTHFDGWSKKFLGWPSVQTLTASKAGNTLHPTELVPSSVVLPSGMKPPEYFLLEVRQQTGYDLYVPGNGLAIYHVDEEQPDNTDPTHRLVDLEQADGDDGLDSADSPDDVGGQDDLYPLMSDDGTTAVNAAFTPGGNPNSQTYVGTSEVSVTNIAMAGHDVTFDVGIVGTPLDLGFTCAAAGDCTSGFCADGVCCDTACTAGACDACSKAAGASDWGHCQMLTITCDDGDPCTDNDKCASGVCKGTPKTCPGSDSCHEVPVCDHQTGVCSNVEKPNGTLCDDGDDCTVNDQCTSGVCKGTAVTQCPAPDACHLPADCKAKKCGVPPTVADNTACDDGNLCTTGDVCLYGVCTGDPVVCPSPGACFEAVTCDPATGTCPAPQAKADGASCDDGSDCTTGDSCHAGVCRGTVDPSVTSCDPHNPCQQPGTCDPATGACVAANQPDGTACSDGNKCTKNDQCLAGACTGTAIECGASDPCYDYQCVPTSGMCSVKPKSEGASCTSDNPCEVDATCQLGTCKGDDKICPVSDECHEPGTCNRLDGTCSTPVKSADGKLCSDGQCLAGVCTPPPADAGAPGPDASVAARGDAGADAGTQGGGSKGCGCASSGGSPLLGLALLLALPLARRRRRG